MQQFCTVFRLLALKHRPLPRYISTPMDASRGEAEIVDAGLPLGSTKSISVGRRGFGSSLSLDSLLRASSRVNAAPPSFVAAPRFCPRELATARHPRSSPAFDLSWLALRELGDHRPVFTPSHANRWGHEWRVSRCRGLDFRTYVVAARVREE